jgi:hypothetical protein
MGKVKTPYDVVRTALRGIPEVEEATSWGCPAWKTRGKMFACAPANKSAEPDSLVVRIAFDRRAELLAEAPETYYITDHYAGYTGVLVRLAKVDQTVLRDLLLGAMRFVATTTKKR